MKSEELYSFIIPCYNSQLTIGQCLDSILNQTCSNWEAICIDDGSTDGTLAILTKYAKLDGRFTVISKKNEGVATARNEGLSKAKGSFIVFVDSDDWIEYNLIAVCGNLNSADLAIYKHRFICRGNEDSDNLIVNNTQYDSVSEICEVSKESIMKITSYACDKVFRRDLIENYNLAMLPDLKIGEDLEFILRYITHCKKICFISNVLYNYNWGNGVTGNHSSIWKKLPVRDFYNSINALHHLTSTYKTYNKQHPGIYTAFLFWELRHRSYIKSILSYAPFQFRRKVLSRDNFTITPFLGFVPFMSILTLTFTFCIKNPFRDYTNRLKTYICRLLK